jgi:hypothetical protein
MEPTQDLLAEPAVGIGGTPAEASPAAAVCQGSGRCLRRGLGIAEREQQGEPTQPRAVRFHECVLDGAIHR